MKRQTWIDLVLVVLVGVFAAVVLAGPQGAAAPAAVEAAGIRFAPVDVYVDAGTEKLAAYQFELSVERGTAEIVGLEGGEHVAFAAAPYYDPAALKGKRVIVAAFNVGADLPSGKTRVARVHMQISGAEKPQFVVKLIEACGPDGGEIAATAGTE